MLDDNRIKEEFELDDEVETEQPDVDNKDEPEEQETEQPDVSEVEDNDVDETPKPKFYQDPEEEVERARKRGWKTFEEHVAAGNDPSEWKTARHFNEYGEFVQKIKGIEQNVDKRMQGLNMLHQMQMNAVKQQNEELQRQRREAIEMGDVDQVQALDQRINQNALQQFQLQTQIENDSNVVPNDPYQRTREQAEMETKFEQENPWVAGQDEKALAMRTYFAQILQQGLPPQQQYQLLSQKAKELNAPQPNTNRAKAGVTDSRQAPRTAKGDLSWADLSAEEKQQWEAFGQVMFTDKEGRPDKKAFLTAVKDARKGV